MDKVGLGIVGCGTISQLNVPGYLQHERCDVVALCDPIRERAETRARQWGIDPKIYTRYEEVLNDPQVDAVELLTPTALHAEQIVAGLKAGKHVSCQKPICNTLAEADEIAAAVSGADTRFRVSENFLYYPPIVKAKELLDSGVIGEPSLVRVRSVRGKEVLGGGLPLEPGAMTWRRDPEANAGGFLFDAAWHPYSTVIWWLGGVEKVNALMTKTDDFTIEMPSAVVWKFDGKKCIAVFDSSYAEDYPIRGKYYPLDEFFEIQGSKGAIWVTRCTGETVDMAPVMVLKGTETVGLNVPMDWSEGFNGAARHFVDSIIADEQPTMDMDFSKTVLKATLAAYKASESDRAVDPRSGAYA